MAEWTDQEMKLAARIVRVMRKARDQRSITNECNPECSSSA